MLGLLRKAAREGRSKRPQKFYSIRDVAVRFHVSPTAVARIFDQLKTEGVLRSVWGSKTILEASNLDRQLRIRGLIALLVPVGSFVANRDCRRFIESLSHELWKQGFASRAWSYEAADAERPAFFKTLIAEKPNAIIWFAPTSRMTALARRLLDCGVRVIRVADSQSQLNESPLHLVASLLKGKSSGS